MKEKRPINILRRLQRQGLKSPLGYLIIVFFVLSVGIGTTGYFYYKSLRKHIKQDEQNKLSAIADLKAGEISKWYKERMGDATVIFENSLIGGEVQRWFENQSLSQVRQEILRWMASLKKGYGYKAISLLDKKGEPRLSVMDDKEPSRSFEKTLALKAMETKKVIFSDLHQGETPGDIHLDLLVPLTISHGGNRLPVGVLLLQIDPQQFFFPLIQSWPTPSSTSETLLIRREGDEVVFLNELRHKKKTALLLRFPISEERLPAAMAAIGKEGMVEGVDYRGVQVLAAIRAVHGTTWFMVAKVDLEEIYAPHRGRFRMTAILTGVLIAGSGFIIGFIWYYNQTEYYRNLHAKEAEKTMILHRYEYLTQYANDIILLADHEWKIIEANYRAVQSYGYTRDELLQLNVRDLRSTETPLSDEFMKQVEAQKGMVFETVHQRKDGATFPVEISIRVIEMEGKKFYQGIVRDITERKRAEEALRQSKEFNEIVWNSMSDIISVIDVANFKIMDVNQVFLDEYGMKREEVIGKTCYEISHHRSTPCTPPEDTCPLLDTLKTGKYSYAEHIHYTLEGKKIYVEVSTSPIRDGEGKISQVVHAVRDISERKRMEAEREKMIRELQEAVSKVKLLSGMLPICSSCKKVRDDKGYWTQLEAYIRDHSEADFSHGLCPACARKLYPDLAGEK